MATRILEFGLMPAAVGAGLVYVTDKYVLPHVISHPITFSPAQASTVVAQGAGDTTDLLYMLGLNALAVYLGVIIGNYLNQIFFK